VAGLYVGALAVALVQVLRNRDLRLLPVLALLAFLAAAHARGIPGRVAWACHVAAGVSALVVVFALSPRGAGR
jgi:hypothetical protein